MLTTGKTATTRVLPVLANTTLTGRDVATAVEKQTCQLHIFADLRLLRATAAIVANGDVLVSLSLGLVFPLMCPRCPLQSSPSSSTTAIVRVIVRWLVRLM